MTYEDVYDLGNDPEFRERLTATLTTESAVKSNDPLADQALRSPDGTSLWFMPLVSAAPGFADKYAASGQGSITDGELLSAVQAAWDRVAGLYANVLNPPVQQ